MRYDWMWRLGLPWTWKIDISSGSELSWSLAIWMALWRPLTPSINWLHVSNGVFKMADKIARWLLLVWGGWLNIHCQHENHPFYYYYLLLFYKLFMKTSGHTIYSFQMSTAKFHSYRWAYFHTILLETWKSSADRGTFSHTQRNKKKHIYRCFYGAPWVPFYLSR